MTEFLTLDRQDRRVWLDVETTVVNRTFIPQKVFLIIFGLFSTLRISSDDVIQVSMYP